MALLMLIALLISGGLWLLKSRSAQKEQSKTVDNTAYYKEAAQYLDPTKTTELKTVIDKIQKVKNYEQDPNMVCPIVQYYLYIGDVTNAQAFLDKIAKTYNQDQGFSSLYSPIVQTKAQLESRLSSIKRANELNSKNVIYYD